VTAQPSPNYFTEYWLLDGVNVGQSNFIDVVMDADHTVEPAFAIIPVTDYPLTVNTTPNGIIVEIDMAQYATPVTVPLPEGAHTVTLPFSQVIGGTEYQFIQWSDGVTDLSRVINLLAPMTLSASYQAVGNGNGPIPVDYVLPTAVGGGVGALSYLATKNPYLAILLALASGFGTMVVRGDLDLTPQAQQYLRQRQRQRGVPFTKSQLPYNIYDYA
jgi:hypothetical protein